MFGLFSSSKPTININDQVWMSSQAKFNACKSMLKFDPSCLFIAWFPETLNELRNALGQAEGNACMLAENLPGSLTQSRIVIFAEHHPLASEEQILFTRLNLKDVPVLSSLDEAFFEKFGGSGTIDLMKKLGMKEDEMIGHAMITKAIRNAQQKIGRKATGNLPANSQKEWLEKNL